MTNIPTALGPLDDDDYIDSITEEFREEMRREPCGADELLNWHRKRINRAGQIQTWVKRGTFGSHVWQ